MKRFSLIVTFAVLAAAAPAHAGDPAPSPAERELVGLVNQERAANGLAAVEISPALTEIADDYAGWYATTGTEIDHRYDPPYTERARAAGCSEYSWDGPVLAQGYGSPRAVLDGWLGSPGHRAVLLDPEITHIGPGNAGGYWLAYGLVCERNALSTSGDYGADPGASASGDLVVGKLKVRANRISVKARTAAGEARARLIAKRGRRTVRGPRYFVGPDGLTKLTVAVTAIGRWSLWLEAAGAKQSLGRVRVG